MGFVEDSYDSAPAAYRAMASGFLHPQARDGHGNVVLGDVVTGGLGGVVVEDVWRQPRGRKPREVGAVVAVGARFAANHRHSTGGVCTRHLVGEVELKKLGDQRASGVTSVREGPTAKIFNGLVQMSESFALRTLASVPILAPCRMVAAVL